MANGINLRIATWNLDDFSTDRLNGIKRYLNGNIRYQNKITGFDAIYEYLLYRKIDILFIQEVITTSKSGFTKADFLKKFEELIKEKEIKYSIQIDENDAKGEIGGSYGESLGVIYREGLNIGSNIYDMKEYCYRRPQAVWIDKLGDKQQGFVNLSFLNYHAKSKRNTQKDYDFQNVKFDFEEVIRSKKNEDFFFLGDFNHTSTELFCNDLVDLDYYNNTDLDLTTFLYKENDQWHSLDRILCAKRMKNFCVWDSMRVNEFLHNKLTGKDENIFKYPVDSYHDRISKETVYIRQSVSDHLPKRIDLKIGGKIFPNQEVAIAVGNKDKFDCWIHPETHDITFSGSDFNANGGQVSIILHYDDPCKTYENLNQFKKEQLIITEVRNGTFEVTVNNMTLKDKIKKLYDQGGAFQNFYFKIIQASWEKDISFANPFIKTSNPYKTLGASAEVSICNYEQRKGDQCELDGDEIWLTGEQFIIKKEVSLKLSTGKTIDISEKEIDDNGNFKINIGNAKKFVIGVHIVTAYIQGKEMCSTRFDVTECKTKEVKDKEDFFRWLKDPEKEGSSSWFNFLLGLLIFAGIVGACYYYYKYRRAYLLAKNAFMLLGRKTLTGEIELTVLRQGYATRNASLFDEGLYKDIVMKESEAAYTFTGSKEALLPLLIKINEHPMITMNKVDEEKAYFIPNQKVELLTFKADLEVAISGHASLTNSKKYIPVNNLIFGLTMLPGQFIYDPEKQLMLILQYDRNLVLYNTTDVTKCVPLWAAESNATSSDHRTKNFNISQPPFHLLVSNTALALIGKSSAKGSNYEVNYRLTSAKDALVFDVVLSKEKISFTVNGAEVLKFPASNAAVGTTTLASLMEVNEM